jgi:hypothetical protein
MYRDFTIWNDYLKEGKPDPLPLAIALDKMNSPFTGICSRVFTIGSAAVKADL